MTRAVAATRFAWLLAAFGASASAACYTDYDEPPPPSLADAPGVGDDDELVFEHSLRWWSPPTAQEARLFRRPDGTLLLLRERWDRTAVYAWAEAELSEAGEARLADALAAVDPTLTEPAPGDYDCVFVDSLTAVVHVDGQAFEYLSGCPPEGVAALAELYEDVLVQLLDCPFDPSWVEGEAAVVQTDCAVARE